MTIKVKDLDKVEAWAGRPLLTPGKHNVRIETAVESQSSSGNPMVELDFAALDGAGGMRDWLVFTEATLGKARMLLNACGIESQSGEWEFPIDDLPGKVLTIIVSEEPDNRNPGQMRVRVFGYEEAQGLDDLPNGSRPAASGGADDDLPF